MGHLAGFGEHLFAFCRLYARGCLARRCLRVAVWLWGSSLLELPDGPEDCEGPPGGVLLWRGLRVHVGIHVGVANVNVAWEEEIWVNRKARPGNSS